MALGLAQEADFFDRWAKEREAAALDPAVVARYRAPRGLYAKEHCFRLLGELRGKTILDVGCGQGEDALLLASLGATVVGVDVSPGAVELARKRAELSGLADRASFICAPIGGQELPRAAFDVIWIDNVLHHVLDELEPTLRSLFAAAKPGAQLVFIEPVNLSRLFRHIRFLVPVHTEVTPGERPLEQRDLDVLERVAPHLRRRHFGFLGRLVRFVIPGFRYEAATALRRRLLDLLAAVDRGVLAFRPLQFLGGMAVFDGRLS
jgi:SAM-dependent methyltransferase